MPTRVSTSLPNNCNISGTLLPDEQKKDERRARKEGNWRDEGKLEKGGKQVGGGTEYSLQVETSH